MQLEQTWRWFGPHDPVSLKDISQTGAEGIVSALHNIPHGDVWPLDKIKKHQEIIAAAGINWDVVESVTIHESIKTRTGKFQHYIDAYKQTLRNLAACDIKIVTYNLMPVNDWTRTELNFELPDGYDALYFSWFDHAFFELYILKMKHAAPSYPETLLSKPE